jgi:hypothetical protein
MPAPRIGIVTFVAALVLAGACRAQDSVSSAISAGGTFNWIGQDLQVTVESGRKSDYVMPGHDLNTLKDLFAALRACWTPPSTSTARADMQMSVRFAFKRDGDMIAPPRMTYTTREAPPESRKTYRDTIDAAYQGCLPLKLTAGLGGAIAGRPIAVRYVESRNLEQPSRERTSGPTSELTSEGLMY